MKIHKIRIHTHNSPTRRMLCYVYTPEDWLNTLQFLRTVVIQNKETVVIEQLKFQPNRPRLEKENN